jgi:hypothetical protein
MKLAECRVVTPIGTSDYTASHMSSATFALSMLFRPLCIRAAREIWSRHVEPGYARAMPGTEVEESSRADIAEEF